MTREVRQREGDEKEEVNRGKREEESEERRSDEYQRETYAKSCPWREGEGRIRQ